MTLNSLLLTYIGGPTALLEFGGARFLTDPTFDPADGEYLTGPVTLHKLSAPGNQRRKCEAGGLRVTESRPSR